MRRSQMRILVLEKSGYLADENFFDSSVPEISDDKKALTSISDDFFSQCRGKIMFDLQKFEILTAILDPLY